MAKSETQEVETSTFTSPTSPSTHGSAKKKHLPPLNPPSSSRASIVFPILNNTHPFLYEQGKFSTAEHGLGKGKLEILRC